MNTILEFPTAPPPVDLADVFGDDLPILLQLPQVMDLAPGDLYFNWTIKTRRKLGLSEVEADLEYI